MAAEITIFFSHCKNISVLFCIGPLRPSNKGGNFPCDVSGIAGNNDEPPHHNAEIPGIPTTNKKPGIDFLTLTGFPGTTTV